MSDSGKISAAIRAQIQKECRLAEAEDIPACVSTVAGRVEEEIGRVCQEGANKNGFAAETCHQRLGSRLWSNVTEFEKFFKTSAFLHASNGTTHQGLDMFIRVEAAAASAGVQCLSASEMEIFRRVNEDRKKFADEYLKAGKSSHRAKPLKIDCGLVQSARKYATTMFDGKFMAHTDKQGNDFRKRAEKNLPAHFRCLSENIGKSGTVIKWTNITAFEDAFMNEEPGGQENHRGSILNPKYTHIGIGLYQKPGGDIYITQHFGGCPTN